MLTGIASGVPVELLVLAWGCVLLVFNILLAGQLRTRQYGVDWNMGPRDETSGLAPLPPQTGRVIRAQANLQETFPVAVAALIGVVLAGRTGTVSHIGAWVWLGARVAYLPVYWSGIKGLRSLLYIVSMVGLLMVLWPLLWG